MRGNQQADVCTQHGTDFNSRLCMRGNLLQVAEAQSHPQFQFTPLHERQRYNAIVKENQRIFQFTPLHERQLCRRTKLSRQAYFNSRLYMRGNTKAAQKELATWTFQFTPLHERQPTTTSAIAPTAVFQFTPLHERQRLPLCGLELPDIFQFTPLHERQPKFGF